MINVIGMVETYCALSQVAGTGGVDNSGHVAHNIAAVVQLLHNNVGTTLSSACKRMSWTTENYVLLCSA